MSSLKIEISAKGKKLVVLNDFKYRFHKNLSHDVKRWVCSISGNKHCPAYLKTEGITNILVEVKDEHNHLPLEASILNRNMLSNALKRKATEDLNEKPMKILHTELRAGDVETLTLNDVNCIRKNIYNARRSILPKLPTNLLEVHESVRLYEENIKTNKKSQFYWLTI